MVSSNRRVPPGPKLLSVAQNMVAIRRDPLGFIQQLAQDYGDTVAIKVGRLDVYLVFHPDTIYEVMVAQAGAFAKGRAIKRLSYLIGDGLLTSDGDAHRRQRKLLQPVFQHRKVSTYAEIVTHHAQSLEHTFAAGQHLDLPTMLLDLTLKITGEALFGADLAGDTAAIRRDMTDAMSIFMNYATIPYGEILLSLPLRGSHRFREIRAQLDTLVTRLIENHRQRAEGANDFLSLLLAARYDDGSSMSDQEIRDEAMTFLLAGHETVGVALTWAWYALAQAPQVRAALHQELDTVLQGRAPTGEDIPQLRYTRQVLTEAMRLYPPLYGITRRAIAPSTIGGYPIAPGANVLVSQFVTQRDPRWFPDPLEFRPERWATPDPQRPKMAYFPFGGGPRVCIGEGFAWMMGVLILATIAQRWDLLTEGDAAVAFHPLVTLRPKGGMLVTVQQQASS